MKVFDNSRLFCVGLSFSGLFFILDTSYTMIEY